MTFLIRYGELVAIHGELAPLVDIHLKPLTRVKVRICYGKIITERSLSVYLTTTELKVCMKLKRYKKLVHC